jgi:hypothetical protein
MKPFVIIWTAIISTAKALRWVQLENRMDLALRLQLAEAVPLLPAAVSTR